jgi:hypothetical protein
MGIPAGVLLEPVMESAQTAQIAFLGVAALSLWCPEFRMVDVAASGGASAAGEPAGFVA